MKIAMLRMFLILTLLLAGVGTPVAAQPLPPPEHSTDFIRSPALNPPQITLSDGQSKARSTPITVGAVTAPTTEWTYHKTTDNAHPDGHEQQALWLMNRARADPPQEGIWLATTDDPDVAGGRDYFGVDVDVLQSEFASYAAKPPAAFDVRLYNAAKAHSDDLIARDAQDHDGQYDRIVAAGFTLLAYRGNVFAYADNGLNAHAAWNIDWGGSDHGMQESRGHRKAIMSLDGDYTNVGLAMVYETDAGTDVGPYVSTGNYCKAGNAADHYNRFIVGTVWEDTDGDAMYDPGEGIGGVTVMPDTGTYYAVTGDSGGYAIPVDAGTYNITFSGPVSAEKSVTVGSESALLDLLSTPAAVPTAPSNLRITSTSPTSITLTWTDKSNNEDGFKIERSPDGSSGWTEIGTVGANVNMYTDANLTCETTYYYRVRAYNGDGNSEYSNVASDTTNACPVDLPATPSDLAVNVTSQTAITLTWTDNSDNEDGFKVERSPDGSSDWTEVGTVGEDVTLYMDADLTCETPYYYRAYAHNADGNSDYSNVISGTTDACPANLPDAPSDLTVDMTAQTVITLTWTDNSDNEDGFKIERSLDGSSGWVLVGTVMTDVTTYVDTGLTPGTSYYYRVFAYNADGASAHSSNVIEGTTAAFLAISKTVDTGGLSPVPLGGIVTYTIVIRNSGDEIASQVVMSDPLSSLVSFRNWVGYEGSAVLPPPATVILPPTLVMWQPGDLAPGTVLTLSFTVNVTNDVMEAGRTVPNSAYVNADNAPRVSDAADFIIAGEEFYYIYLPLIMKNFALTLSRLQLAD